MLKEKPETANAPPAGLLRTTAGDLERERRSRVWNALEALGIMVFVLVVLWPFAYGCGILPGIGAVHVAANALLIAGGACILLVLPFVHGDTLDSWGLGDPRVLWRILRHGTPRQRALYGAIVLGLFAALNYANYNQRHEVGGFFGLDKTTALELRGSFPGILLVFAVGTLLSGLIISAAIRYDNFLPAFATAMKVSLPLLVLMFLAALKIRGWEVIQTFRPTTWLLGVFGYVFWGFIQQLLFSAYFGTRFRKAFAPSAAAANTSNWAQTVALFAAGAGVLGAALIALAVRIAYGEWGLDPVQLALTALFLAPIGAVYGHYFRRDPKRLLVATLAASCFGLIHIDSYGLVFVTWGLGIVLVYVFMEDKNRNLVALGFIHGLLGSSFGEFFSSGKSGLLEVDYSVGPWNVDNPAVGALIIPMLCIGVYVAIMAWCVEHIRE